MARVQKAIAIPEPTNEVDALWRTTLALKEAVEVIQGIRGNREYALKVDLDDVTAGTTTTIISGGGGGANALDDLTDVTTAGQLQYNLLYNTDGTNWAPTAAGLIWNPAGNFLQLPFSHTINFENAGGSSIELVAFEDMAGDVFTIGDSAYKTVIDGLITNVTSVTVDFDGTVNIAGMLDVTSMADFNASVAINSGNPLTLFDSSNQDSAVFDHDGTDFYTTFTGTTDWNLVGLTSLNLADSNINRPVLEDYAVKHQTLTISGGNATTMNLTLGNAATLDLQGATGVVTVSLSDPPATDYGEAFIYVIQSSTARTITWPGTVTWQGGAAPILSTTDNYVDLISLITVDGGTNWRGTSATETVASGAEADTLADVTARGATTAILSTFSGGLNLEDADVNRPVLEDYAVKLQSLSIGGNAAAMDLTLGNAATLDLQAATGTVTVSLSNPPATDYGEAFIYVIQSSTARTINWTGITWQGGPAPVLSTTDNYVDLVSFITVDGGATWRGTYATETSQSGLAEVNDLTAAVTWDDVPDVNITVGSVTQHVASIDHDLLLNYIPAEHLDWAADQGATNIHRDNLQVFGTAVRGDVPLSGGGTINFLRADGTWSAPPGGSSTDTLADVTGRGATTTTLSTFSGGLNLADADINRPVLEDYAVKLQALSIGGNAAEMNLQSGNAATLDLQAATGTVTVTLTNPPATDYGEAFIYVIQSSTARLITWPVTVTWQGGIAPVLSTSNDYVDLISFITTDGGGNWHGTFATETAQTEAAETNDLTAAVVWANVPDTNITQGSVTQHVGAIDHDLLLNFLSAEHLDWAADQGATNIHRDNLQVFGAAVRGDVPLSGGGTTNFLRADGSWSAPPGGSSTDTLADVTGRGATTAILSTFSGGLNLSDADVNRPVLEDYAVKLQALSIGGNAAEMNLTLGNAATLDLQPATGTVTVSLTNPPATDYGEAFIYVIQSSTARLITWPGTVTWQGGTAPVLSTTDNYVDLVSFITTDGGTNWHGTFATETAQGGGAETNDLTAAVVWANVPNTNITQGSVTQHVGAIDHDLLLNFLSAEHLDWAADQGATNIHRDNLQVFGAAVRGDVPLSGGGTANYLRADGTWSAPPGGTSSNSFETQTVTDTDSGYTWAATGSAVATGPGDTLLWVSGVGIDIDVDATSDAIRFTTIDGEIDHDLLLNFVSQEHIRWDLTGTGTIHADNYTDTVYSHPNHSGHVTSVTDGAQTVVVAAITGQADIAADLIGTDEFIVSDGGNIRRADISRLNNYLNGALGFLTSYTETDTLAAVTGRGASTTTLSTFSGGLNLADADINRPVLEDYAVKHQTLSIGGNAATMSLILGNAATLDLQPATGTVTVSLSNPPDAGDYGEAFIYVIQSSTARLINWTGVTWQGGIAPVLSTSNDYVDLVSFITVDGGINWRGTFATETAQAITAETNDLTAAVVWANVPNTNITQGSVTQHEAALTILESQITNANVLARIAGNETITGFYIFKEGLLLDEDASNSALEFNVDSSSFQSDILYDVNGTLTALVRFNPSIPNFTWADRDPSAVDRMTLQMNTGDLTLNTGDLTLPSGNIIVSGTVDGVNIGDNYANWNTAYGWGDHSGTIYEPYDTAIVKSDEAETISSSWGFSSVAYFTHANALRIANNSTLLGLNFAENANVALLRVATNDTIQIGQASYDMNLVSTVVTAAGSFAAVGAVTGSNLNIANWDTAYGWSDHALVGYITADEFVNTLAFNTGNGILTLGRTISADLTVDLDGRYLTSFSEADTLSSVTGRGASTTTASTFSGGLNLADADVNRPVLEDYAVKLQALTISGGTTATMSLQSGNAATLDLQAATGTVTVSLTNPPTTNYGEVFIYVIQSSTARLITWPGTVTWQGGVAPVLSTSNDYVDLVSFVTVDGGTNWHGTFATETAQTIAAETNDLTAAVVWANVPNTNITQGSVTQHVGAIDHDLLLNFLSAEHLDWTADQGATNIHRDNLQVFGSSVRGDVPLSGGGTINFLRADGSWAAPPGGTSSNSFETQTVTDTDSGYTWAATGSAVADSATDTLLWVSGVGINIDVDATSDAIRVTTINGEIDHDLLLNFVSQEHIRWDLTGTGTIHADNYTDTVYSHPNHSGHVTSVTDGAQTVVVAAITGQTDIGANLVATDEFIVSDAGVIRRADISRLNNYLNGALGFLTSYTETDTLSSVTGRGASTSTASTFSGGLNLSDTDVNRPVLEDYAVKHQTLTISGGTTATMNLQSGNAATLDLQSATGTVTVSLTNPPISGRYGEAFIYVVQSSTARLITWPGTVTWQGGAAPVLSTGVDDVDLISFVTVNGGTNWHGTFATETAQGGGYTHPAHPGDDFDQDTGLLANAFVISDININLVTDTQGHVTDANCVIATRQLTAANVGAAPTSHSHTTSEISGLDAGADFSSGTMPVSRGGTGVTSSTGSTNTVRSASPTFTGTVLGAALTFTGQVQGGTLNASSDVRLKENLSEYVPRALTFKTYNYDLKIGKQKDKIGYLAHEVAKDLPGAVVSDKDGMLALDYNMVLVAKIAELEARLKAAGIK